eukprot:Nk52_evm11s1485 gene=Nk52_evmTU11s1485
MPEGTKTMEDAPVQVDLKRQGIFNHKTEEYTEHDMFAWKLYMERYELTRNVRDLSNWHALDLGCGDGTNARFLLDLGAESVTAVDISAEQCEIAKRKDAALGYDSKKITYIVGDYNDLEGMQKLMPEQGKSFDVVLCSWVYCMARTVEEVEACSKTISYFLKPEGKFMGMDNYPDAEWLEPEYYFKETHFKKFYKGPREDGTVIEISVCNVDGGQMAVLDNFYYSRETLKSTLAANGLSFEPLLMEVDPSAPEEKKEECRKLVEKPSICMFRGSCL